MKNIAIIPAYEPPDSFPAYARDILNTVDRLIVVDDGSGSSYDRIFDAIAALPQAQVLRLPENRGKGYALKYAYTYCGEHFAPEDILVTADCDGQHAAEGVRKVCAAAGNDRTIVLGVRDFTAPNVPPKSRAGNKQMRLWLKILYGIDISDSQTGLRACTVETAQRLLKVSGNRFEYETGTLIYAKRNQITVKEVPIRTIYPENKEDHVTHFRAFRDSMRVIGTLLTHLIPFVISSSAAAVTDVVVFALFASLVFPDPDALQILLATVTARILSSIVNFFINCKHVFHGKARDAIVRYYILWFFQLSCSYGLVYLFSQVLGGQVTVVKVLGDLFLSLVGYQIQCRWVYRQPVPTFYGGYARFVRGLLRAFSPRYNCSFPTPEAPVVYVCRHLNMHGPYTTIKWLPEPVHPLALHVFFDRKDAIHQFATYTFSRRYGKEPKKFDLKAWVVGSVTAPLVNSLQAVPVYRGGAKGIVTVKKGLGYLLKQESLVVFADIAYTDGYDKAGPIYEGFLAMGELYRKKTGRSLPFIPLLIDDAGRRIHAGQPVTVDDFKRDREEAAKALEEAINFPQKVKTEVG